MEKLITKITRDFPSLRLRPGSTFYWAPDDQAIFFDSTATGQTARWSLLHEVGHALLEHKNYTSDMDLLALELTAWEKAQSVGNIYNISIKDEHIQQCLDSYRDWIYKRSTCPICSTTSAQQDNTTTYHCYNCHHAWQVSNGRFCRSYRSKHHNKNSPVTLSVAGESLR